MTVTCKRRQNGYIVHGSLWPMSHVGLFALVSGLTSSFESSTIVCSQLCTCILCKWMMTICASYESLLLTKMGPRYYGEVWHFFHSAPRDKAIRTEQLSKRLPEWETPLSPIKFYRRTTLRSLSHRHRELRRFNIQVAPIIGLSQADSQHYFI